MTGVSPRISEAISLFTNDFVRANSTWAAYGDGVFEPKLFGETSSYCAMKDKIVTSWAIIDPLCTA
jgi:hypothetical protein